MPLAPFVQLGKGAHPVVDLGQLRAHYPDLPVDVWKIGSASDLLGWEDTRAKYGITSPDAVPCDVFVWGIGEPPDRRLTRVGGVPWLPKSTPWPRFGRTPATFLCQFDFRDSKDLQGQLAGGPLPGDLLLVFVAGEDSALTGDEKELRFVWVSADENEVYAQEDIPAGTRYFDFVSAWGARFRSQDIPSKWAKAYKIPKTAGSGRPWSLPVLWATKIGGVPFNSQENHRAPPPDYLCQLVSIQTSSTSWPWINREQPPASDFEDEGVYSDKHQLMIGDMGELTLFLRADGTVSARSACG